VAPSRMVGVSASVNLPLHHKVQKFSSGTGSSWVVPEKGPYNGCGCVVGLTLPETSSEVKVIGQSSRSQDEDVPLLAMNACYKVTYFTDAQLHIMTLHIFGCMSSSLC